MFTKILVYLLLANSQAPTIPECVNSGMNSITNNWPYVAAVTVRNPPSTTMGYLDHSVRRVLDNCTDRQ